MIGNNLATLTTDPAAHVDLGETKAKLIALFATDVKQFFHEICLVAVKLDSSDIFWKVGAAPALKCGGYVIQLDLEPLSAEQLEKIFLENVMTPAQKAKFESRLGIDIAMEIPDVIRFRINVYRERGHLAATMRLIPIRIPLLDELGLPDTLASLISYHQGLILITGPTGSGKSTTLASMIEVLSSHRRCNIITIEDPIEYLHHDHLSIISQREVGVDTHSFEQALREVVREAPDVIMVGEMRDVETMTVAMGAAETGHLVLSTVHTNNAAETIERIVNMFPVNIKVQTCLRLSTTLLGICSQKLIPPINGDKRACAVEILVNSPAVREKIKEGAIGEIYNLMLGGEFYQMRTMNQSLLKLYSEGKISEELAIANSYRDSELKQLIRKLRH